MTDGSDETVRECISFQCGEDKYRCTYGACVNKTAECNNFKDCADNSGKSNYSNNFNKFSIYMKKCVMQKYLN